MPHGADIGIERANALPGVNDQVPAVGGRAFAVKVAEMQLHKAQLHALHAYSAAIGRPLARAAPLSNAGDEVEQGAYYRPGRRRAGLR